MDKRPIAANGGPGRDGVAEAANGVFERCLPRPTRLTGVKITILVTSLSSGGGAEQQVALLAERLLRRGWQVQVVSMLESAPAARPLTASLAAAGIPVVSLGMRRGFGDPRALVRLGRVLRRFRPDVVHAHMVHANLLARASRLLVRTPVVVSTLHNQNEGGRWRYIAYRLTHPLSSVTTAVSEEAAAEATRRGGAPAGGIRAVPNGVQTARFRNDPQVRARARADLGVADDFLWLGAGRLVPEKGFDVLITAFATVAARSSTARLVVAGTGPLATSLRKQAAATRLGDRLTFLGFRSDLPELMQAADAFVLSSHWEGLPMVLLEAAASSLPIVATEVAGSRAAVVDGVNGIVVPAGQPDALAAAMLRFMEMPVDARRAMADASRAHAEQTFEIERVVDTWERIYREALPARSRAS